MDLTDIDTGTMQIIDFLLENPVLDYSKQEIAEGAGIARSTLYRHWDTIEDLGIVEQTRTYQNTRLYRLDQDAEIVDLLGQLRTIVEDHTQDSVPA